MKAVTFLWLLVYAGSIAVGAEPPVREGLVLWLDASGQREARQKESLPSIGNQQPVDILLDTSGHRRQAIQPVPDRRPILSSDGEAAYLKFDGKDDFMAISGARQLAPAVTIFV